MYVTNLTSMRMGIVGPIVLAPNEKDRYLDDSDNSIIESVLRLAAGSYVSYSLDEGIEKTSPATVLKTDNINVTVKSSESLENEKLNKNANIEEKSTSTLLSNTIKKTKHIEKASNNNKDKIENNSEKSDLDNIAKKRKTKKN